MEKMRIIKKIREAQVGKYIGIYIFMILGVTAIFLFRLFEDLSEPTDVDFVAYQYKDIVFKLLAILSVILFLPSAIAYFAFNVSHPVLILFSVPWWLFLSFVADFIYSRICKKPKYEDMDDNKMRYKTLANFGFFSIFLFFGSTAMFSFLYYPLIDFEINFDEYILVASLLVIIVSLFYNIAKEKLDEYSSNLLLSLTLLSLYILLVGVILKFADVIHLPSKSETMIDVACIKAFEIGTFAGGLIGLFYVTTFIIELLKPKKKL